MMSNVHVNKRFSMYFHVPYSVHTIIYDISLVIFLTMGVYVRNKLRSAVYPHLMVLLAKEAA